MDIRTAREAERDKYVKAYQAPNYHMGGTRMAHAMEDIRALDPGQSFLDVSCGRGEMLDFADSLGYEDVIGTEIVPELIAGDVRVQLGYVHDLPFADERFDVVTMLDVIEHLIPGDDERACSELLRVARRHIILTANNKPSRSLLGEELHINRRPYEEWHELFQRWFSGCKVTWIKRGRTVSETWRIDL